MSPHEEIGSSICLKENESDRILKSFEEVWKSGRIPEKFNFARDVFDKHVQSTPSALALWVDDNQGNEWKWTYKEVQEESIRAAEFLRKHLTSNDETHQPFVMTVLGRVPEWWFFHLGCIRSGSIFCPGTIQLTAKDIAYRLETSGAAMILTDEANIQKVDEALKLLGDSKLQNSIKKVVVSSQLGRSLLSKDWIRYDGGDKGNENNQTGQFENCDTRGGDFAVCFFTSGSTGNPKLVGHTHASVGIGNYTTVKVNSIRNGDIVMNLSDTGWAKASFMNHFAPWTVGACSYVNQTKISDAKQILKILQTQPITNFCIPPTMYKCLIQETDETSFKFKSLRVCSGGGEPIIGEVARVWEQKTGFRIQQVYGQSEMTPILCSDNTRYGSLGIPNRVFNDIRIVDEDYNECNPNVPGRIVVNVKQCRPIGLFAGYLKRSLSGRGLEIDKDKTSQVFLGDLYNTGDMGYMDESGYLFYTGRSDDIISSSGYRIGPSEIEAVLQTHPAVSESAAVSSPDPLRGEVVKAFIVLSSAYKDLQENDAETLKKSIQNYVKSQTAPYKYPRKIQFVDSLPRTLTGKILRRKLKRDEFKDTVKSSSCLMESETPYYFGSKSSRFGST